MDPFTNLPVCISVRVRILVNDTFLDIHQRFMRSLEVLTCLEVCESVVERQGISQEAAKLFGLWIVGKDLEIQIRPSANLLTVTKDWPSLIVHYTHQPTACDPDHMFNRYWLLFRREATVCKSIERTITLRDPIALKMLYGEAKRNIITGRYPCTVKDAINLAALQVQGVVGDYDALKCGKGYIAKNLDLVNSILSSRIIKKKDLWGWERAIMEEHMRLQGVSQRRAQVCFLDYVRQWRCYGCSFFPMTKDPPPAGFFEFRVQKWMIGVGPDGVVIFERDRNSKYHFIETWAKLKWVHTTDTILLYDAATSRHRYRIITPQAELVHNLASRIAHLVRKGVISRNGCLRRRTAANVEGIWDRSQADGNDFKSVRIQEDSSEWIPVDDLGDVMRMQTPSVNFDDKIGSPGISKSVDKHKDEQLRSGSTLLLQGDDYARDSKSSTMDIKLENTTVLDDLIDEAANRVLVNGSNIIQNSNAVASSVAVSPSFARDNQDYQNEFEKAEIRSENAAVIFESARKSSKVVAVPLSSFQDCMSRSRAHSAKSNGDRSQL